MKKLLIICYTIFFISCSRDSKNVEYVKQVATIYPDSLSYSSGLHHISDKEISNFFESENIWQKEIKDQLKQSISDKLGFSDNKFNVYLLSSYSPQQKYSLMALILNSISGNKAILATVNMDKEIISMTELPDSGCDVMYDDLKEIIICDYYDLHIATEKKFKLIHQFQQKIASGGHYVISKDSIISEFSINDNGITELIDIDSIKVPEKIMAQD